MIFHHTLFLLFLFHVCNSNIFQCLVCECDDSEKFMNCMNKSLNEIPKNIPDWIEVLDFSGNKLTDVIAPLDFSKFSSLVELNLNKNLLHSIPIMETDVNLTTLSMSHNRISTVSKGRLEKFPFLKNLDLSGNRIDELKHGMFPNSSNIESLNLNNNNISKIVNTSFDGLRSLNELKLNRNNLTSLSTYIFSPLVKLETLDLNQNQLTEITAYTFFNLVNLTTLRIRHNAIHTLNDGAFFKLINLNVLQLDRNLIKNVTKNWLYSLKSLHRLSLSHNAIREIEGDWEDCSNITDLDLSFNQVPAIEEKTFRFLNKLKKLILNNNHITSIAEGAFLHTPELIVLDLNNNNISWTFEDDSNSAFIGLKKLRKLNLAGNMITTIHPNAFAGLDSLMELDLQGNPIRIVLNNSFSLMPQLEVLFMNSSWLLCDCNIDWLPEWLSLNVKPIPNLKCEYPERLKDKTLVDIPRSSFLCVDSPKPHLVEEPTSQVVLAESNVTLSCRAKSSSDSPMSFIWKRHNQEISRIVTVSGVEQSAQLNLYNVSFDHSAKYQCIVSNKFSTTYSRKAELSVVVFPVFLKKPSNVTIKVGSNARLECAADGHPAPQIAWRKDGGNDFRAAHERRMRVMPTDDVFFILNVKPSDSGIYTCTANNRAGTATANASLTVLEAPSFVKTMDENRIITIGEAVVLECNASGSPKPKLTWRKDGKRLFKTDRHFFTSQDQLLVITSTVHSDEGVYECEISNSLGVEKGYSRLTVLQAYAVTGNDENLTGVIMMTFVCCAVVTSAVWVVIIYYTSLRARQNSEAPVPVQALKSSASYHSDSKSDNSNSSKDSGTGNSTNKGSNEDLLAAVKCAGGSRQAEGEVEGVVGGGEVSLPLLTRALVMPTQACCSNMSQSATRTDHNRCCRHHHNNPNSYLCLYLPPHQAN
ncbi:leucine-rich repeats and immunoglobulin-like domains protein 3 [Nilaparvata lugens]|uniref:leucine-rich repeats and immunoglobulin-like domains protein 3 n=1 Tax=Nilaparvata lugens TaxID=108931 RepID=UPI000B995010|nr:leucine-rich repeats and immunoglobulin-like domains protein 3 [Nilaparvata lugens]